MEHHEKVKKCEFCLRPVAPSGLWWMPIDGLCACIFWRSIGNDADNDTMTIVANVAPIV